MKHKWIKKKLGDFLKRIEKPIRLKNDKKYKRVTVKLYGKGIKLRDEIEGKRIGTRRQFLIKAGQLLLSRIDARNGAFGIVSEELDHSIVTGSFWVFDINRKQIIPEYLQYFVRQREFFRKLERLSFGTTNRRNLDEKAFLKYKIKIPPLSVQQKIVERLDTIRKAQELSEKQISLANELFQSLLHQELKPKKIWWVKKLREVCEVNPKTNLDLSKEKVKYVEMAAIDKDLKEIQYFLDRPTDKVSSGASKFRNGDVIFARITPCTENGKVALVEDCNKACAGSTELHVLRAKQKEILPHFLFYYLTIPRIKNMAVESMTGSTGRQRVPAEFFSYLKISLPPLKTQRQIVEKLTTVQDYKKKLLKKKELFQELFESTLNKAMNGELV